MKIVCLGDSLTYGIGVRRRETWAALAASETGWDICNKGISGDTTSGMLARFSRDVLAQKPDVAVLMGGGNDLLAGCPRAIPQSNLMAMVFEALAVGIIPVVGIPTPGLSTAALPIPADRPPQILAAEREAYHDWLVRFCSGFGVLAVDFRKALPSDGVAGDFYLDGIHPTPALHRRMAHEFTLQLRPTLGQPAL